MMSYDQLYRIALMMQQDRIRAARGERLAEESEEAPHRAAPRHERLRKLRSLMLSLLA